MLSILFFIVCILMFILGMNLLRIGLFNISGQKMTDTLKLITSKPWKGMLSGTVVTAALQSSSAVMVIIIGLISTKSLTFPQSIGIILGTNIGTTVTTELISLHISSWSLPMVVLGLLLMLRRNVIQRSLGFIILGLGIVFFAMSSFEKLALPLIKLPFIKELIILMNESLIIAIIVGAIFTAIIHSSSAMTGIAMGFLASNVLSLDTGIAIMLGSNIGTCVTALLASIGAGRDATRCAYAHIYLNVIGVIAFFPLIHTMEEWSIALTNSPATQLAHASVIFNVASSLIALPFAEKLGRFIEKVHK